MKGLLVFAAFVAFVAAGVPLVPKDNSHYVEGETRYIWVDAEDEQVLVDLHEPLAPQEELARRVQDTQYWLFTRRNQNNAQIITMGNAASVRNSNYLGSRPLKVVIHGFAGNGNSDMNTMIRSAWLAVSDANVIVVDWRRISTSSYVNAINETPALGRHISDFITFLFNTAGGNWNNVHIAGFSLGGQIAGNAGRISGGRPRRVTGLDPVSPAWFNSGNALGRNAGQYVEIIHTNYDRNNSPIIGHADFYVNGAMNQPGCSNSICNHNRSFYLFAATIRFNHLLGRQCANVGVAQRNQCTGPGTLHMGNSIMTKRGNGIFGLSTGANWPF